MPYNYKRIREKKQDWKEYFPKISPIVAADPVSYFQNLPPTAKEVLNYLLLMSSKYKYVSPSQTTIAKAIGRSRQHVNLMLGRLEADGVVASNYRHLTSCQYKASPFFSNPKIRSLLSHIFEALKPGPIKLLMLSLSLLYAPQTQFNLGTKDIYNISLKTILSKGYYAPRGSFMENLNASIYGDNPISLAIRDVKSLHLTRWGQIKLSAFPDHIIIAVDQKMRATRVIIKQPFNYYTKCCLELCREQKITPDWSWSMRLATAYNMPENPIFFEADPKNSPHISADKKPMVKNQTSYRPFMVEKPTVDTLSTVNTSDNYLKNSSVPHPLKPFVPIKRDLGETREEAKLKIERAMMDGRVSSTFIALFGTKNPFT